MKIEILAYLENMEIRKEKKNTIRGKEKVNSKSKLKICLLFYFFLFFQ